MATAYSKTTWVNDSSPYISATNLQKIEDAIGVLDTEAINAQTGTTYTIVAADQNKLVTLSNTSAITVTLPQDSDLTFPVGGRVDFLVINTGMATFAAGTGATVNATPSAVSRAQWSAVSVIKRAASTWVCIGDLA